MAADANGLAERVFTLLSAVPDPEIPVISLTDLGIIREVRPGSPAEVVITPTYSGCPASIAIQLSIRQALDAAGLADIQIRTELSPAWTTDWISEAGRQKLLAYGIAPPESAEARLKLKGDAPAICPQCGSARTQEISRYGSTPCKALWRCLDCAEPFDRFKCI
ncbi:1,2-phenylacetyl-CoA epoxidase subunit PaaD [Acidocella aromatica]|uniref:Ring-1,2-phenylacetyl-CoA epoxidase subunit PaaD n=1 Tax=Acidocella aromatica TaxID=1303579 RepID=A0A840VAR0_9PROT|nr:1,2-phenylacetyl-CoA epoxidase subunit PaaD [Acidocella aromatica]MBB5373008.1 ring-1,2-phenylacetyl-CoA epoxidase subunit PaaD [Acidocella aromatica]